MKCPKCHADNTDTARYCSNCATSLGASRDHGPSLTKTLKSPTYVVAPGTVIAGHYEVQEKLGHGGMGEVYRALDKNLGRQVAIKILPAEFSTDPERLARFEREAKLLATLNHPNIAAVYGFEEAKGLRFLVLELVEGETLQTRLDRGTLPMDEALETCRQVAEGLEAAHERGVVHRDLKPGNIMITPEGKVKVLDFGLARAYTGETTGIDIANSPTITAQMTEPGVILGTAAYMSPEQARGGAVDRRSDIWAFGCVLYECLTGCRAFHGETVSDTLAHILKGEPDWNKLPTETPTLVKVLLRRCLEKDPRKRLHDIADARIEIEAPTGYPSESVTAPRRFSLLWMAAVSAIVLIAGIIIGRFLIKRSQPAPPASVVTSIIKLEPGHWLQGMRGEMERPTRTAMTISSDGMFVVYSAIEENPGPQAKPRLYLRRIDQSEAKSIAGTEGGDNPFLSPDNRWVGFSADGKLKKVPVEGGVPGTLCDLSAWFLGATWGHDNSIVFADGWDAGLSRLSAEGGKPEILTKPDPKRKETGHRLPSWLPNGKAVLFTVIRNGWDWHPCLALLRLETRDWRILLEDAADARYVPSGHLVFLREGTLMAVRFNLARMEVVGQPVALVGNVMQAFTTSSYYGHTGAGQFSVSDTGSLIYAEGGIVPDRKSWLVWVDQRGIEQPVTASEVSFSSPRLSPDGKRIAYIAWGRECLVSVYDLSRGTNDRLTTEGTAYNVIWSPDGKRLLFSWCKFPPLNLYWRPSDGSSSMEHVATSEFDQQPGSWSLDGKTVAIHDEHPDTGSDIAMLDVGSGRVTPFLNSPFNEEYPEFSPDAHWIAYTSDESNRRDVYVRPFPGPGMKCLVSSGGGSEPLWARNVKQLFYRQGNQMWVVDFRTDGGFAATKPRLLFEKPGYAHTFPLRTYDLSFDGQRFLMVKVEQRKPTPATEMILALNWFEELKRLIPAGKK
jgi:eukaryotic-like serine/threonine-protein kinase